MSAPAATRIPLSEPSVGEREATYLRECVDENWVASRGRFVHRFEELFAQWHGVGAAVSTVSGTAALHTALAAFGVGPGDEVIVPALTFVATANPVLYVGATPVFADVDPATGCLDPDAAAQRLSPRTRAVIPVHLFGHPVDIDRLHEHLADREEVVVIEDATEALGSSLHGAACGTLGHAAAFSFNGNKVITTGGGGMLLARDPERLEAMRHLTLQSRVPGSTEYLHDGVGFNYVLSNLHAAVGVAQLERLPELLHTRRTIAGRYREALRDVEDLHFMDEAPGAHSNFWLMSVLVDEAVAGRTRHSLQAELQAAEIDARPYFHPLPDLAPYRDWPANVPVSRRLHEQGLCIPSSASLTSEQQERVIAVLRG